MMAVKDLRLVGEFTEWLKKWFKPEEAESVVRSPWSLRDGCAVASSIGELLQLAAQFTLERIFGRPGRFHFEALVKVDPLESSIHVVEGETRTLVLDCHIQAEEVAPQTLERLLREMLRQAEEARDACMSTRILVLEG